MPVRMQSTGSCSARFENQFSHAGINQTTHQILLCVDVSVSILLPGFRTGTQVANSYAVAETVIVGGMCPIPIPTSIRGILWKRMPLNTRSTTDKSAAGWRRCTQEEPMDYKSEMKTLRDDP